MRSAYVLYLAVLPKYRSECIQILKADLRDELEIFISAAHLDPSVKSGIPGEYFAEVRLRRLFGGRAFVQTGFIGRALKARTTVVDLNPRSVTAWTILGTRRILQRRTLVWGHIHPQAGAKSGTAGLRRAMRRLANGTISYTYRDAKKAQDDLPGLHVWTAPNSLYPRIDIQPVGTRGTKRSDVLYVGRLAAEKKIDLLVRGFALAAMADPGMRLVVVGGGDEESRLRGLAVELGIADRVSFAGWIDDIGQLREFYETAFCTVSTGFAGLGLTQSLGFGVPMIVADSEPHSPEIELEESGGVSYFESDSPSSLAVAILAGSKRAHALPDLRISEFTRERYSAEAMANGLRCALLDNKEAAYSRTSQV